MTRAPGLLTLALCAGGLLAACAASPVQQAKGPLAQDSVTTAPETAACLARNAAVDHAGTNSDGTSVLEVAQAGADGRIEVSPGAAGSQVTYEGQGAPPKAIEKLIHACTIAP